MDWDGAGWGGDVGWTGCLDRMVGMLKRGMVSQPTSVLTQDYWVVHTLKNKHAYHGWFPARMPP